MREDGMLTLREEGVLVALDGKTSLDEILRVTQNDDAGEPVGESPRAGPAPAREAA
jgi:hypothetical protein